MARGERCWQGLDDDPHWIIHSVDDFATIMMMIRNIMKTFVIMMIYLQWHAGNVACKVLMMNRTGWYILLMIWLQEWWWWWYLISWKYLLLWWSILSGTRGTWLARSWWWSAPEDTFSPLLCSSCSALTGSPWPSPSSYHYKNIYIVQALPGK